jgi:transposase InsO family protein
MKKINVLENGNKLHNVSYSYKELLQHHGIIQSMRRKGDFWNNAVAESFFIIVKEVIVI